MSFDPDLYRRTLRLAGRGQNGQDLNLSVIDAGPRDALRTIVFLHGMGGYAGYWHHQLNHFYEGSRVIAARASPALPLCGNLLTRSFQAVRARSGMPTFT